MTVYRLGLAMFISLYQTHNSANSGAKKFLENLIRHLTQSTIGPPSHKQGQHKHHLLFFCILIGFAKYLLIPFPFYHREATFPVGWISSKVLNALTTSATMFGNLVSFEITEPNCHSILTGMKLVSLFVFKALFCLHKGI